MRRKERYTNTGRTLRHRGVVVGLALLVGCATPDVGDIVVGTTEGWGSSAPSAEMSLSYLSYDTPTPEFSSGKLSTRSLVDKDTTVSMAANFLRADEDRKSDPDNPYEHQRGLYTFDDGDDAYSGSVNWETAYLLEATLMSSPDNSEHRLRSVFLDPVQSYDIRVRSSIDEDGNKVIDTTDFYHTRMVSWYPLNCQLKRNDSGVAAVEKFGEMFPQTAISTQRDVDGDGVEERVMAVQFTNLDGHKDVMVSDMKEAQYWHFDDKVHRSDFVPDGHPYLTPGENIYRSPFGHFYQEEIDGVQRGIDYANFFTYKHYLSAVRIYAYADDSPQTLLMWGKIENVVISDQPTSVKVWLPDREGVWGEAFDWADRDNFPIATDPIFGEGDTNSEINESVDYPISMEGSSASNEIYLGYALIQPDNKLSLQLHTSSGVYLVDISNNYEYEDENGNKVTTEVFKAGNIYDVHLNLKTTGTIAALLEKEAGDVYYDLTRLITYDNPGEGEDISIYRYANCHICSPMHTYVTDSEGNYVLDAEGNKTYYDGFCFSATTIGNGQGGIFSSGVQTMYPTTAEIEPKSARLLWESSLGLVTQVELLYGYVRFKVPDRTKEGNAVIAVYDSEGNVLWSWHIWITDPPQEQTFENGDNDIVILDRNLGATSDKWTTGDGSTALETYGLYYQWGRKDPSMTPPEYNHFPINLMTQPYYDYSSRERVAAEVMQFARPTLRDGVENPMYLIMPTEQTQTYYYNWTHELYDFLWGYNYETQSIDKTIYDPCPFGYRVPSSEINTILAESDDTTFSTPSTNEYGQIVTRGGETFYFPYAGYKGVDRGLQSLVLSWRYVGEMGDYMSAEINRTTGYLQYHRGRNYIMRKSSHTENNVTGGTYTGYRIADYTNRRTAASVRCVKNVPMGSLQAWITTSESYVTANDELILTLEASSSESYIVEAILTVTNLTNGDVKRLYKTPDGTTESNHPSWSRVITFNTGNEGGEFYSPKGYSFSLTCRNNLGVAKTVTESVGYHTILIDLSAWEEAESNERAQINSDFERIVHIVSDVAPSKVEIEYVDHNGTTQVVDITDTQYTAMADAGAVSSSLNFVAPFNFAVAGTYDVTVRATCGGADAHVVTAETTVTVYSDLTLDLSVSPDSVLTSAPEEVVVTYEATANDGNITSATLYLDGVVSAEGSVTNNSSAALSKVVTIGDIVAVDVDGDGRVVVAVEVIHENGSTLRREVDVTIVSLQPIEASIELSRTEIFFGDKTESATIKASASSPNGALTSVTITTSDGDVLYSGNPAVAEWSLDALDYDPTSGGLDREFIITAEDEYGKTATATVTADVYRVTQRTVTPTNLTSGGTFIIENASDTDSYLYANGSTVSLNSTLSTDVFVTISGGNQIEFSNGRYLSMTAGRNNCTVSASTSSQTVTMAYSNNGYTITKSNGSRTYYLYNNNNGTIAASRNTNSSSRYWNIYEITTD